MTEPDIQETVRKRWSECLETDHVSDEQDFFLSGGHSLLAVRLTTSLREDLAMEIPVSALFETRTLTAYTTLVERLARVES